MTLKISSNHQACLEFVKSSLGYTDFVVRLCDVHPNGRSMNLCDGVCRVTPLVLKDHRRSNVKRRVAQMSDELSEEKSMDSIPDSPEKTSRSSIDRLNDSQLDDNSPDTESLEQDVETTALPEVTGTTPQEVWAVKVDMWATAHRFEPGHCVRIHVASGAHPRWARNSGNGQQACIEGDLDQFQVAHQTVYFGADPCASYVELPLLQISLNDST